ncbi:AIPR family protein [Acetobacterium carbinolicum]|uniref:AIPR family protein n=1 Tax=Acetobacterium carbinolicum TaxID=52690 RepID=UPI0039BF90F4
MAKVTKISHPIIESYVENFINQYEISSSKARDQHTIFEQYINSLILSLYGNDPSATFEEMETGTAFGIDGLAIFVSDKLVTSEEDVDLIVEGLRKFEVSFFFIQSKTTDKFDRQDISDFLSAIRRFFNFDKCEITELRAQWEIAKYIYSKSSKFKKSPTLKLKFVSLSPKKIDLTDPHLKSTVFMGIDDINEMNLFSEVNIPEFLGIKDVMNLQSKVTSELEISINMAKQPVPYPKDISNKIKNGYYGLIKLEEFIKILTDDVGGQKILRKGIFDDNIRYYLGAEEKFEVNFDMKNQLIGKENYLFGLLNNGITIIGDEVTLNSEDLTLVNYQIVNGCQTSNVIFECLESLDKDNDIYIPIRLIATEDEDTKNAIIRATNSQTPLKPEQIAALSHIQKSIEQYYTTKLKKNNFPLYYERRTEQYRDDNISRTKILNIPFQIKSTAALFFDLPHEVSGQYGKVEKNTRGLLFKDSDISYLNSYYVSGLSWYKVERFVQNNEDGRKFRRARWHIIMLLKYLCCPLEEIAIGIGKKSENNSKMIELILLDDNKLNELLKRIIEIIEECLTKEKSLEEVLSDRKVFERKETTTNLIKYVKNLVPAVE